ncbi:MAG: phytanoyl-CoA dioxygenase family protein [Cyanobacteria bacterium SZAS-4]|nr:phytanoyl-CoA dioxygenase family protein [Cyanobacteria bacterium SZAS-4]
MHYDNELADEVAQNGFAVIREVVEEDVISKLTFTLEALRKRDKTPSSAGVRHLLKRSALVRKFANSKGILDIATKIVGTNARPVKAILFDKTPDANWYVTWHQDLTIAVKEKIEVTGFGPWSIKDGITHVQPPSEVLQNIVSLRVHLDDCPPENGPIKFIAGSHAMGIMSTFEIAEWRDTREHVCASAARGDVIVMRPLILHSSSQSSMVDHRRVLHIEFVGAELPNGLSWAESSGLDSVELIMAIEEEFGLEIPNEVAENLFTVGQTYEYLRSQLDKADGEECFSQRLFYKLRKALVNNFNLQRREITPESNMSDLVPLEQLEEGWSFLRLYIDQEIPNFEVPSYGLFFKGPSRTLTMRELVFAMMNINRDYQAYKKSSEAEVWNRLVAVVIAQLNVNRDEVTYNASFSKDLGVC